MFVFSDESPTRFYSDRSISAIHVERVSRCPDTLSRFVTFQIRLHATRSKGNVGRNVFNEKTVNFHVAVIRCFSIRKSIRYSRTKLFKNEQILSTYILKVYKIFFQLSYNETAVLDLITILLSVPLAATIFFPIPKN